MCCLFLTLICPIAPCFFDFGYEKSKVTFKQIFSIEKLFSLCFLFNEEIILKLLDTNKRFLSDSIYKIFLSPSKIQIKLDFYVELI